MNPINNRLFQPFTFPKDIPVRNKVAMAPMTTRASNEDYTISDDKVKHYSTRVKGIVTIPGTAAIKKRKYKSYCC
jgi:2,4-dienoyl-CoA reductase-like NADH-dependent reductase (Old Yellow Enzyme family)